jgi:hypothetical protein
VRAWALHIAYNHSSCLVFLSILLEFSKYDMVISSSAAIGLHALKSTPGLGSSPARIFLKNDHMND